MFPKFYRDISIRFNILPTSRRKASSWWSISMKHTLYTPNNLIGNRSNRFRTTQHLIDGWTSTLPNISQPNSTPHICSTVLLSGFFSLHHSSPCCNNNTDIAEIIFSSLLPIKKGALRILCKPQIFQAVRLLCYQKPSPTIKSRTLPALRDVKRL